MAAQRLGRSDFSLLLADKRLEINYTRGTVLYIRAARNLELAIRGVLEHMRTRSLGIHYLLESEGKVALISRSLGSKEDSRHPQGAMYFPAQLLDYTVPARYGTSPRDWRCSQKTAGPDQGS